MEGSNRRLVIALGGALGFSLLVIAFLLGRVTAKPAEAVRAADAAPALVVQAAAVVPTPLVIESTSGVLPTSGTDTPPPANFGWVPPPAFDGPDTSAPDGAAPARPPSAEGPAIAAYFAQIEQVDDVGAGDPQAFATSMLQSVSSGDFSGFDDLLARSRQQHERLRRITPPQACMEHHRLAIALSGDSVTMLNRLKAALVRGDSTALMTIATEGHTLEGQANRLKSMGESIKRSVGL